jgi:DNA invertase Pin-like site-specific DNA recombinase
VLTVWKLDRLGRSLPHLVGVLESLKGQGVGFRSFTEAIDTESTTGRLLGHIIGALAEFERSLIIERTQAGLKAAKRRGA